MNINEAIVKFGTEAVRRYRCVAGIHHDNEVPEIFLGGFIAGRLHDEFNVHAHVERLYTVIANELQVKLDTELIIKFGGLRADIALYSDQRPVSIVELKIFDESRTANAIVADRDKVRALSHRCGVDAYLGVLITDVQSGKSCTERARELSLKLGCDFDVIGDKQSSADGSWFWCFASIKIV
jgi:hypothetical protein